LMISTYVLATGCLFALGALASHLAVISGLLLVVGICLGIGLAQGALMISRLFDDDQRASMLVATDASFSLAGFLMASLSVYLLASNADWYSVYLVIGGVTVAIVFLVRGGDFSRVEAFDEAAEPMLERVRWPTPVWLLMTALFFYTLGQTTLLTWLPAFGARDMGLTPSLAGGLVGNYWLGMFIGQLLTVGIVLRLGVSRMVVVGALGCFSLSVALIYLPDEMIQKQFVALLWGIANFGLLKCIISKASESFRIVPATLVSMMLLAASVGTALSPVLSSRIVESGGLGLGIGLAHFSLGLVAVFILASVLIRTRN
ncbi:MAG: MFS transporter, partial [Pseudomonadales bacterium]